MLARILSLLILMGVLTSCSNQKIQSSKFLEIDNKVYLCKKITTTTGHSSPLGKNPQTGKKVIVLNREFLECSKIPTETPEMMLKTTYLGVIRTHD